MTIIIEDILKQTDNDINNKIESKDLTEKIKKSIDNITKQNKMDEKKDSVKLLLKKLDLPENGY